MPQLNLADRIAELPYRLRPRPTVTPATWPLTDAERQRLIIRWPSVHQWKGSIPIMSAFKAGFTQLGITRVEPVPQPHKSVIMLECILDGRPHTVTFDCFDKADFISDVALAESDLYIKCQYREAGYDDPRIVRGGYPVTFAVFYKFFGAFRAQYAERKTIDITGRFGYAFQREIRSQAVAMLTAAPGLVYRGTGGKVRYSRFLREVAASRLALHLPGNGPFTHRVAEFLALGTCMLSLRFPVQLHVPLVPGVHYVEIADDLSDLVEKTRYYLAHHEERERIAAAGREFFDRYLHCDELASYHARCMIDRLGASA